MPETTSAATSASQLPDREIIEEEQRHRALHGDVVDAVVHQVFADRVVPAGEEGDLQLGADAVGGADQHRLAESGELVARAEAADVGQHACVNVCARKLLDGGDGAVGLVDIDAGVAVRNGFLVDKFQYTAPRTHSASVAFRFPCGAAAMAERRVADS